ncbi:MAG: NAD(P)H-dependent glycerol-3-phosphate dehydrogenase [Cyanobacteria bacterium J06639_1]
MAISAPLSGAILGAGAWGTALASLLEVNRHPMRIWSRRGGISLAECVRESEILICAIAMRGVPEVIARLQKISLERSPIIVTATKGLDPSAFQTPSQLWQAAFPHSPVVVLSGPNLAKEITRGWPAATTVASRDRTAAARVQALFASKRFRVYTHDDPLGTELGGTLKNIIAIAAGACDGLQLGANAKAALIARGLAETIRVGQYFRADAATFAGLSGMGDLIATCNSPLSRNYQVGYRLAQGDSLANILAELVGTAEGIQTAEVVVQLSDREGIPVPITRQVLHVLQETIAPREALAELMERDPISEFDRSEWG